MYKVQSLTEDQVMKLDRHTLIWIDKVEEISKGYQSFLYAGKVKELDEQVFKMVQDELKKKGAEKPKKDAPKKTRSKTAETKDKPARTPSASKDRKQGARAGQKKKKPASSSPKKKAAAKSKPAQSKVKLVPKPAGATVEKGITFIDHFTPDLRIIRRFVNLDGKTKSKRELMLFINYIKRAIIDKQVTKKSKYGKQVAFIQDKLIDIYNQFFVKGAKEKVPFNFAKAKGKELKELISKIRIRPSVQIMKRYVNLNAKPLDKQKVLRFHRYVKNKLEKRIVNRRDPHYPFIKKMLGDLEAFTCDFSPSGSKTYFIEKAELNGLLGVIGDMDDEHMEAGLSGVGDNGQEDVQFPVRNTVVNSMDLQDMEFEKLGFEGRWLDFVGNPSPGFSAMIFGKPKFGKSYLAIEFAGYLARHHGTVLYIAREEGIDETLQKKLKDKDVLHPDLFVSDHIPDDLTAYDFIFFDSVTKLHLTPDDLDAFSQLYPDKSFIYIFQTRKDGDFRGVNSFAHEVDVIIEVPEKGLATQNGRFNQGGEMDIF